MTQLNPFIRGYESFRIERNLQITDEGDSCSGLLIPDTDLGENPRRERGV
ncbi:hypothetical protein I5G53_30145 [Pseudomonas aeruginosa]|nr:hypothetical protein [Pseudomonas aeruginosa]